ncbi:MAG: sugar transferase [Actinomycetes bacterium]|nr:MAG: glycosyl transferase [Actinomycetota bacterium]
MRTRFVISVGVTDLIAFALAVLAASQVEFGHPFPWEVVDAWPLLGLMTLSMVLMSVLTGWMSGPGVPRPTYGRMAVIAVGTWLMTSALIVALRVEYFSRPLIGLSLLFWLVPATLHRIVRRRRPWTERIAVITREKQLADELLESPHAEVIWVIPPDFVGDLELPERDVTIAVDMGSVLSERMAQFVSSCDVAGYRIRAFSSIYEEHTGRVPLVHVAEGWEISLPLLEVARWLPGKRLADIVFTVLTSPIWIPVALLVALYVRIADPSGPVLFKQERVGLEGQTFTMYKFRTMRPDAEDNGPSFARPDDPRLIRGGAFLRKSRLDELPQLINVLKGDMSLVGPRAEQVPFAREFRKQIPFYDHRHLVRPGITGWAQVNYGYADDEADTVEKLTYDLYYIKHMSPVLDMKVLWKSIWTVLTGAGAQ